MALGGQELYGILRFSHMRFFGLAYFPLGCDQTDVEIELSSQSYVDSTIFKKNAGWLSVSLEFLMRLSKSYEFF